MKTGWRLVRLEREEEVADGGGGGYLATFDTPSGARAVRARAVVSTAPTHSLKEALAPVLPGTAGIFDAVRASIKRSAGIYYPPVCAVTVAYPKSAFRDVEVTSMAAFAPVFSRSSSFF